MTGNMNSKRLLALLLVMALLVVCTACGSAEKDKKKQEAATTAAAETGSQTGDVTGDVVTETGAQTGEVWTEPGITTGDISTETGAQVPTCEPMDINVAVLTGPTAIAMAKVMQDTKEGISLNKYQFTVAATADEITAKLMSGEIAIASIPCNLASTLYNKSNGKVVIAAVNNLGVLSILENGDSVQSLEDLRGKTIYATGAGTTPEYTLRALLSAAGIDPDEDVNIEFLSAASEVAAKMTGEGSEGIIAMLPQPFASSVLMNNAAARQALDINTEWNNLSDDPIVTGVIAVNAAFLAEHKDNVEAFLYEFAGSAAFATENVDETAQILEDFEIFKSGLMKKAIPLCNISCLTGSEMKSAVESYLGVLYEQNPASVGGAMPGADFYYGAE